MNLLALPAFTDNHIWMFHDGTHAVAVDPEDSAPVISALAPLHPTLAGILVTRHPNNHAGGLCGLRAFCTVPRSVRRAKARLSRTCVQHFANGRTFSR